MTATDSEGRVGLSSMRQDNRFAPTLQVVVVAAAYIVPVIVLKSPWACVGGFLLDWWFSVRTRDGAFFTRKYLQAFSGPLGLRRTLIPLSNIDDIVVEPEQAISGAGTINVRHGLQYLIFPCVADAERKADLLRLAVTEAIARERRE